MATATALDIYVIYARPRDLPAPFVVRKQSVWPSGTISIAAEASTFGSLADARASLPPGLFCIAREPSDDPVIVESWV
jgi:hypothetical protein